MSTFGESHGPALGVVLDGFPAGMELCEDDIQRFLDRRKPGRSAATTSRPEADKAEILSGVFGGKTTGTPIAVIIRNTSQRSGDYDAIADLYRPGHADMTFDLKYGFRDHRGGGRSSGRETAARVAAGAICQKLLSEMGITVLAYTSSIGDVHVNKDNIDRELVLTTATSMPDADADRKALELIKKLRAEGNSIGSSVDCIMDGVPAGIGDPVFCKLDALLAGAVMSIGSVKSVSIGDGHLVSERLGSENNDSFIPADDGSISVSTNHAGGILGGISDGAPILLHADCKPTPSISIPQDTVNKKGEASKIIIEGRHDPVIAPRAAVVVETMCAFVLLDSMLAGMSSRAENVISFYCR